tara:strand:- start:27 stop:452 length:426 start_codon:yes stop_codon:yes gene_type:complete
MAKAAKQETKNEKLVKQKSTSASKTVESKSLKKTIKKKPVELKEKKKEIKALEVVEKTAGGRSKLHYRNQLSLDEAVAYFEAIIVGLKKKKIEFHKDDESINLEPQDQLIVEVKASTKAERSKISFKMSWSHLDPGSLSIK